MSDLSSESDKKDNISDDELSDDSLKLSISSLESVERQNQDLLAPSAKQKQFNKKEDIPGTKSKVPWVQNTSYKMMFFEGYLPQKIISHRLLGKSS